MAQLKERVPVAHGNGIGLIFLGSHQKLNGTLAEEMR